MPTHLALDDHLQALAASGTRLRDAAARAGVAAAVPTCPAWDVTDLVAHQGMVHRWAAANLRGDGDHDAAASESEGKAAPDILAWFTAGLDDLLATLRDTTEDAEAMVFLKDAPPPRRFWARRQAHETTIHSIDAVAAEIGHAPLASDVPLDPSFAADGIDELLCGFIPRRKSRLRSPEPFAVLVTTIDTGHAWTVQISDEPVLTTVGDTGNAHATLTGTAAQLYLGLWNRGDELKADGRDDVLTLWRDQVRVLWR
ncbi:maleylpyruvate isomerase family mycothiol-dependent enzyme [Phytoactinopolyspora halotolerans]|uniref:Maleylpyruvate isomerase family mycothiol-dependent enzyme n=1 Tax=Phytoactinopolyspora halotolerans TaxID=1981512 RepID=A0A6L9SES7_9ACTN|nr:maleylpyruvate isomerase family mycothiol-dependent enzyme [Phytoactinopolyspora halotolerans]NEE03746.1 maleylpyruvate isomerase family mycothiol-dependent enzyme [Phytoactinopolyspora halotolerans]